MVLKRPAGGWQSRIDRVFDGLEAVPGASLSAAQRVEIDAALGRYLDLLVTWNERLDLTAARGEDELVDLFVADAALLARFAGEAGSWVDVGSGAGAPGLSLKLICPELPMQLVEPKSKRVTFLRTAQGSLGVRGLEVRREQSQTLPPACAAWGVSRATLAPDLWLKEGVRIATAGVWVLLAQGEPPEAAGWRADIDVSYVWALTGVSRRALRYVPSAAFG